MSSIRTRYETAKRIIEQGSGEGSLVGMQSYCFDTLELMLSMMKGADVPILCCHERVDEEDGPWLRCDAFELYLPLDASAKRCAQCLKEIEEGLPALWKAYKSKLKAKAR
jgi:hypothetical protein